MHKNLSLMVLDIAQMHGRVVWLEFGLVIKGMIIFSLTTDLSVLGLARELHSSAGESVFKPSES